MADLPKSVALVYDRVNKWGGAEQVLLALHEIFPTAPLFTSVYNSATAPWAQVFPKVIPSFLQHLPFAKTHHELYPWLTPLAFETLDLCDFDAVVSVTSSDAKAFITRPETFHLCYCLTPTRYLYSHPTVPWPISSYLKYWDQIASHRPDAYVAISRAVQDRIKKYYGQDSQIVYPPANIASFPTDNSQPTTNNYFLSVNRLVYHKEPEALITVFNELELPLTIIGSGRLENKLRRLAKPNINILTSVSDSELRVQYQNARAYVSVHEEDFGIVYAEAHAAGLPIIALNRGGVRDVVTHNQTGLLLENLTDLKDALRNFDPSTFDRRLITDNSKRFSRERFASEFAKVFTREWEKYKSISTY